MPFKQQRASQPSDPVRVLVAGSEFSDWFDVDIDSDIFTPADGFTLTGVAPDPRYLGLFREGQRVDVYVGPDRQMAGILDDPTLSVDEKGARVTLSGRDLGGYLVDSEVKAERFSHYTLGDLARHLLLPEWGIKKVIVSNEDNRRVLLGKKERERFKAGKVVETLTGERTRRKHTKLDPGQTVRQVIDEHCTRAGVWWWLTADGNLFIGKPQYDQQVSFEFFLYGPNAPKAKRDNNNVFDAKVARGAHERYSKIIVTGESSADSSKKSNIFDPDDDATTSKRAKKYRGEATDPDLVARGITRELRLVDNDALSNEMCQAKADAEMGRRRLTGLTITLTVDDFRQNGRLFTVDCLARVVIEEAGIDGVYWISQRRFREERQKRRTTLTLHEKGVWLA
jgi:prophage tail gpP-like protein